MYSIDWSTLVEVIKKLNRLPTTSILSLSRPKFIWLQNRIAKIDTKVLKVLWSKLWKCSNQLLLGQPDTWLMQHHVLTLQTAKIAVAPPATACERSQTEC